MARLKGPDESVRVVYLPDGRARAQGLTAKIFLDQACTQAADIQALDGTPIPNSTVTIDAYSKIPQFLFPSGVDDLYTYVNGGPVVTLYASTDARLDAIEAGGVSSAVTSVDSRVGAVTLTDRYVQLTQIGAVSGVASLDSGGKVPTSQLPAIGTAYRGTWTASTTYAVGDLVTLGGELLRCNTAHTSGTTFSLTNWDNLTGKVGQFNVRLYGAKGDVKFVTDTITVSGSATVTSASANFTAGDVGKSIMIAGVGTSGRPRFTTIQSVTNTTTIILATTATAAITGAVTTYGTDDTAAIRAAITARDQWMLSSGTFYGETYFPPGFYGVAGAPVQGGSTHGNSQFPIIVPAVTGPKYTAVYRGAGDPTGLWHWQQTVPQASGSVIVSFLDSTLDGTYGEPSVFGGPTPAQGYGQAASLFANVLPVFDGIGILMPDDPRVCGIDLRGCAEGNINNAGAKVIIKPTVLPTGPTQTWQFGLAMPMNNNNDLSRIGTWTAEGMNFGVIVDEHTVADRLVGIACVAAVECGDGNSSTGHGMNLNYVSAENCNVGIGCTGGSPTKVNVQLLDWEGGSWNGSQFAVVNDTNNNMFGTIRYTGISVDTNHLVYNAGGGNFAVRGSQNLRIYDDTRRQGAAGADTPAVPTSTTVLRNPLFRDAMIAISGGTGVTVALNGVAQNMGVGTYFLGTGQTITLTYTGAPTWVWTLL